MIWIRAFKLFAGTYTRVVSGNSFSPKCFKQKYFMLVFFFILTGIIFITFTEPSMQHLFYFIFLYVPDYVFTSNFCTVKMTWIHVWFSKRCTVRFLFRFLKTILKPTILDVGTPPGGTRVTFDYFNNSRWYGQRSCYTTQLLRQRRGGCSTTLYRGILVSVGIITIIRLRKQIDFRWAVAQTLIRMRPMNKQPCTAHSMTITLLSTVAGAVRINATSGPVVAAVDKSSITASRSEVGAAAAEDVNYYYRSAAVVVQKFTRV